MEEKKKGKKALKVIGISAGILAVLAGIAAFIMAESVNGYQKIYPGVSMGELDLSGLSRQEAKEKIQEKSRQDFGDKEFVLSYGDIEVSMTAEEAGICYDADTIVDRVYGIARTDWLLKRYLALHGRHESWTVDAAAIYSTEKIEEKVDEFIAAVSRSKVDPSYEVKDKMILLDKGESGRSADRSALITRLTECVENRTFGTVSADVTEEAPEEPDLDAIYREVYSEATSSEIQYYPESWTEETADQWTEEKLKGYTGLHKYVITKGSRGVEFDLEAAKEKVASSEKRYVVIPLTVYEPEDDTASIEAKLFRDVLATWTTKLNTGEVNRTSNIDLAAKSVNGTVLCPDDVFSYNTVVGARTAARGYKDAKIFQAGEVVDGIGGGICQLSSTIYIATLRAGLETTERYSHRFAVSYTALGQDATVAWGSLDYKFKNSSAWPVKLTVSRSGGNLTVSVYGTKEDDYTYELRSNQDEIIDYEVSTVYLGLGTAEANAKGLTVLGQSKKVGGKLGYKSTTYLDKLENGKVISTTLVNHSTYKTQKQTVYVAAYLDAAGLPYMDAAGNLYDPYAVPAAPEEPEPVQPSPEVPSEPGTPEM